MDRAKTHDGLIAGHASGELKRAESTQFTIIHTIAVIAWRAPPDGCGEFWTANDTTVQQRLWKLRLRVVNAMSGSHNAMSGRASAEFGKWRTASLMRLRAGDLQRPISAKNGLGENKHSSLDLTCIETQTSELFRCWCKTTTDNNERTHCRCTS